MDPRYDLEHGVLPGLLFTQGEEMITLALARGVRFFTESYRAYFAGQKTPYPYEDAAFSLSPVKIRGGGVLQLFLPEPRELGHCGRVYLCFDGAFARFAYYYEEYGADGAFYLCRMRSPERSEILSPAPPDAPERVTALFMAGGQ